MEIVAQIKTISTEMAMKNDGAKLGEFDLWL